MRKWIVFRAEKRQPGSEDWKYAHTGALTKTLCEHFDSSDSELPEPGYRPPEFIRVEQFVDAEYPAAKTHHRQGDWEVTRVEVYEHEVGRPYADFDMIVICHCKYAPINAPLKPMPDRQVSIDSFGGDQFAYESWLASQKELVKA